VTRPWHILAGAVIAALLAFAARPGAQGVLDDRLRGQLDNAPLTLEVGCGELNDVPCARILPALNQRTEPSGVLLKPSGPQSFPRALSDVCEARAAAAIVPRDVMVRSVPCPEGMEVVGKPLFPVYGFLVVPASAGFRGLSDLTGDGAPILVDVDGEAMWNALSVTRAAWTRDIEVTEDGFEPALRQLLKGSADAYFTVMPLNGGLMARLRTAAGANGRPLYGVIDLRMANVPCVYRPAMLEFSATKTLATLSADAVLVLGRSFRAAHARGGPPAGDVLVSALDSARETIQTAMAVPRDWRPAATSCH
jgi:hypothetical protein